MIELSQKPEYEITIPKVTQHPIERAIEGKRLLFRTVGMLTKLVERFDSYRAREDEEPRDEDENDHEDE